MALLLTTILLIAGKGLPLHCDDAGAPQISTELFEGLREALIDLEKTQTEAFQSAAEAHQIIFSAIDGPQDKLTVPEMTTEESDNFKVDDIDAISCWHYDPNDAIQHLKVLLQRLEDEEDDLVDTTIKLEIMKEDLEFAMD